MVPTPAGNCIRRIWTLRENEHLDWMGSLLEDTFGSLSEVIKIVSGKNGKCHYVLSLHFLLLNSENIYEHMKLNFGIRYGLLMFV